MIVACKNESDSKAIEKYIEDRYFQALYLYLDLKKYGCLNSNVKSWMQWDDGGSVVATVLKYHTGMHIFSRNRDFDVDELIELILVEEPSMICAEADIIIALSEKLPQYKKEIGHVAKYALPCSNPVILESCVIKKATEEDYFSMAEMLLTDDDIGASYTLEDMIKQISERINDGYSRSYCVYCDGKIVAQASTGAEESGIATVAYVIVDPKYRGKGYGSMIVEYMCCELLKDGFEVYLVYYSNSVGKMYSRIGFNDVCDYGKLYVKVQH